MDLHATTIEGLYRLRPTPFRDERGFFTRTFDSSVLEPVGLNEVSWVQESQSRSPQGTLRGVHLRTDGRERKVVRCASGAIFDVVVDLRPGSPSLGRWEGFRLDDVTHEVLVLPPGCGHGFLVLSESADVCYKMDAPYAPEFDATLRYDDPKVAIAWPAPPQQLSARDRGGEAFDAVVRRVPPWTPEPHSPAAEPSRAL